LPSMRLGQLYNELTDGKKIFLTTERQLVCEHGELSSNISYWCAMEKKARADGSCLPPRGGLRNPSVCDCQSTEGLNGAIPESTPTPAKPSSLFEFLEAGDAEVVKLKGRDARRVPHTNDAVFVSTVGRLTCRHGASRKSLIKRSRTAIESKRLPGCGCITPHLPIHGGLQLGKYCRMA